LIENFKRIIFSKFEYFAVLFMAFGLFGFIPTCHYVLLFGFKHAFTSMSNLIYLRQIIASHFDYINILAGAAQWLVVMAVLYISGAALYAGKSKT
jgi:hypothetical protein